MYIFILFSRLLELTKTYTCITKMKNRNEKKINIKLKKVSHILKIEKDE